MVFFFFFRKNCAWVEWELGRVDMAVPLSPDEVVEKRHAIFRHLSQKDIVPFPGDDPREH
jgi:glucosamine-6-phosphate deaminase